MYRGQGTGCHELAKAYRTKKLPRRTRQNGKLNALFQINRLFLPYRTFFIPAI